MTDEEVECVYVLIAFSAVPESFGERVASDFQFRNLYIEKFNNYFTLGEVTAD